MTREEFSHSSSDTQANLELSEIAQLTDNGFPGCGNANAPATPGPRTPSVPLPCSRYRYSMSTTETRTFRSRHSRCCMGTAAVLLSLLTIGGFLGIMIHFTVIDVLWKDSSSKPKVPVPRAETSLGNTVPDFLGSVKISNMDWSYKLGVSDSLQYRDLAVRVELELDRVFLLSPLKDIYNFSLVRTFRRGSIVAVFETVLTEHRALTSSALKEAMTKGLDNRKYIRGPDDVIKNKHVVVLEAESITIVALSTTTLREESTTYTLPMLINTGGSSIPTTTTYTQRTTSNIPSSTTYSQIVTTTKDTVYDHSDHDPEVTSTPPSPIPSWFWTPWRGTHFTPRIPSTATVTTSRLAYPHTVSIPSAKPSTVNFPLPSVSHSDTHRGPPTSPSNWSFFTSTKLTTIERESVRPVTTKYPPTQPITTQTAKLPQQLVTKPLESSVRKNTTLTPVTSSKPPSVTPINIDQIIDSIPGLSRASIGPAIQTNKPRNSKSNTSMSMSSVTVPSIKHTTKGYFAATSSSKTQTTVSIVRPSTTSSTPKSTPTNQSSSNISSKIDTVVKSRNQIPNTDEHYPVLNNTRVRKTNVTNVIETIPDGSPHTGHPRMSSVSVTIPSTHVQSQRPQYPPTWRDTTMIMPVQYPTTRPTHTNWDYPTTRSPYNNWHYPGTRPSHSNGHGFAVRDYVSTEPTPTASTRRKEGEFNRRHDILQTGTNTAKDREFWAEGDQEMIPSTTHPFPDYLFTDHPDEMYDYIPRYPNNVANVFPNDGDTLESTAHTPGRNIFEADDVEHPERDVTEGIHERAQFDDKRTISTQNNSQTRGTSVTQKYPPVDHLLLAKGNASLDRMPTFRQNPVTMTVSRFAEDQTQTPSSSVSVTSSVLTHPNNDLEQTNDTVTHRNQHIRPSSLPDPTKLNESLPHSNTAKPKASTIPNPGISPSSTLSQHPIPAEYRAKVNGTGGMTIKGIKNGLGSSDIFSSRLSDLVSTSEVSDLVSTSESLDTLKYVTVTPVNEYLSTYAGVTSKNNAVTVHSYRPIAATVVVTTISSTSVDASSSGASANINNTSNHQRMDEPSVADYEAFNLKPTPVLTQVSNSLSHLGSLSVNLDMTVTSTWPTVTTTTISYVNQTIPDEKVKHSSNKTKRDNKLTHLIPNHEKPNSDDTESRADQPIKVVDPELTETQDMNADDRKDNSKVTTVATTEAVLGDESAGKYIPSPTKSSQTTDGVDIFPSMLSSPVLTSMYTSVSNSPSSTRHPAPMDQSYKGLKGKHKNAVISDKISPTLTFTYRTASTSKTTTLSTTKASSSSYSNDLQDLWTVSDELESVTSHEVGAISVSGFIDATSLSDTAGASVTLTGGRSHSKEQELPNPYSPDSGDSSKPKIPANACLDITVMTEFIPTCLDFFSRILHTDDDRERCQHFFAGVICVTDEFYKYSGQQCSETEISAFIKQHAGLFKNALPNFDPLQCVV